MNIYKAPVYTLNISFTHDKTGEVISRDIELDHEDYLKLQSLKTEEEKQVYLSKIVNDTNVMSELSSEAKSKEEAMKVLK